MWHRAIIWAPPTDSSRAGTRQLSAIAPRTNGRARRVGVSVVVTFRLLGSIDGEHRGWRPSRCAHRWVLPVPSMRVRRCTWHRGPGTVKADRSTRCCDRSRSRPSEEPPACDVAGGRGPAPGALPSEVQSGLRAIQLFGHVGVRRRLHLPNALPQLPREAATNHRVAAWDRHALQGADPRSVALVPRPGT